MDDLDALVEMGTTDDAPAIKHVTVKDEELYAEEPQDLIDDEDVYEGEFPEEDADDELLEQDADDAKYVVN